MKYKYGSKAINSAKHTNIIKIKEINMNITEDALMTNPLNILLDLNLPDKTYH